MKQSPSPGGIYPVAFKWGYIYHVANEGARVESSRQVIGVFVAVAQL